MALYTLVKVIVSIEFSTPKKCFERVCGGNEVPQLLSSSILLEGKLLWVVVI